MMQDRLTSFEDPDRSVTSSRDIVGAWIVVTLVLCATVVGFVLDRAATISP